MPSPRLEVGAAYNETKEATPVKEGTDRIARAKSYLAIAESGDARREAFAAAADEIIAAQEEDPALTLREIDRQLGRGKDYSGRLVKWRTSAAPGASPFAAVSAEQKGRGVTEARRVLREGTPEEVQALVRELPEEKQRAIVRGMSAEVVTDRFVQQTREQGEKAEKKLRQMAEEDPAIKAGLERRDRRPVADLFYRAGGIPYQIARLTRELVDLREGFDDDDRARAEEIAARIMSAAEWFVSAAEGGVTDWDSALEALLAEEG